MGTLTLALIAVAAAGLTLRDCEPLVGELETRAEPLTRRLAAGIQRLRPAASAGTDRNEAAHVPGVVLAAVPVGDRGAGLDRDGYVVSMDSLSLFESIPLITGLRLREPAVGRSVSSPHAFLGIGVVMAFDKTPGLGGMLSSVDVRELGNPRAVLRGGVTVWLGSGKHNLKLERLREVLTQAAALGMNPGIIDLRFDDQVVVRPGHVEKTKNREV